MSKLSTIDPDYLEMITGKHTVEMRQAYCEKLIDRITTSLSKSGHLLSVEQKDRNIRMLEAARAELTEVRSKGETLF